MTNEEFLESRPRMLGGMRVESSNVSDGRVTPPPPVSGWRIADPVGTFKEHPTFLIFGGGGGDGCLV